ncbi:hypothetical protein JMJ35_008806 [Cladonia borealis]|uniref:Uncharacterized protein n=1 Tax=Cladonia borealis TaxID=184061 RepID=A0AA39V6P8_9LECA|nr:hypothetical protein JMJ35_008806 [Cladonia borealis]
MDTDSNKNEVRMSLTSNFLSFCCFLVTAYYILKLFKQSQDGPMLEPSLGRPYMGGQDILRTSEVRSGDQSENAGTGNESSEEKDEVGHDEHKESFGVEEGKTDEAFLSESEEGGAMELSEQEDGPQEGKEEEVQKGEEKENEEAQPQSNRKRSRTITADNNPTSAAPGKKQRIINPPRKPTPGLLKFHTKRYRLYDATIQNRGAAVEGPFRHFGQFDDYALYINPNLQDPEFEQIPHSGVRLDDLTVSKVLKYYGRTILRTRWPAEFDQQGMIRATRVPLGRAAKRWVDRGERDVDEKLVKREGWYYLSWGGIHTLMGKEGLDADRYWVRPSHESFKCPGLGFKISDWAKVQLAPEHPADPTFL